MPPAAAAAKAARPKKPRQNTKSGGVSAPPCCPIVGAGRLVAAPAQVEGIDSIIARRRAAAAARQTRSRARRRAHCAVYGVTITDTTLDVLVKRWHWLTEAESMDRREIERAISENLAEAAAAEKISNA